MVSVWYSLIFALVQFHFQSWHPPRVKLVLSKFLKVLLYYKKRIIAQILMNIVAHRKFIALFVFIVTQQFFRYIMTWYQTNRGKKSTRRGITKWSVKQLTLDRWLEASTLVASIGYKDTSVGLWLWSITISTAPPRPGSL